MPKVSVIIPVYGVEKYIERCARSLFEQTLEDMEFIFVDDCTPDRSIKILEDVLQDYPKRRVQTRIIHHEENGGLPIARQTGLKFATGDFIAHCDSDDWVDLNLYETLFTQAVTCVSDVVAFDCKVTDGDNTLLKLSGGSLTDVNECIVSMMHIRTWWSLCNKLVKRKLYEHADIIYPQDGMAEDMCLTLQLMYYCRSISYNKEAFYYYYQNPSSIIHVLTEEKCVAKFNQICNNVEIVKQFYSDKEIAVGMKKGLKFLEYNAKFPLLPILGNKEYYTLWRNTYKGCECSVLFDSGASIKERIRSLLCIIGVYPFPRDKYKGLLK